MVLSFALFDVCEVELDIDFHTFVIVGEESPSLHESFFMHERSSLLNGCDWLSMPLIFLLFLFQREAVLGPRDEDLSVLEVLWVDFGLDEW